MAAPERFADRSVSSCTVGAVHTWPITPFRGNAGCKSLSDRNGHQPADKTLSENDPKRSVGT